MTPDGQQVIVSGDNQSTISAELHVADTHTFDVADGAAPVDLLVTGQLSHWHGVAWGGIRKTGSGTMHLASSMDGTNSAGQNGIYGVGGFELAGGTLIFSGSLGYSPFDPANKAGYFLADFSADSTLKWDAGNAMDVSVNGNLRIRDGVNATLDTNGNDVTLSEAIVVGASQTGSLTKTGDGTLALLGAQPYATLNTEGGRTDLANVLGTGSSTINASAETNISVNQTLEALNIGDDAIVSIGDLPPPAPAPDWAASPGDAAGVAAVPEPGSAALLFGGMLSLLVVRRRRA